MARRKRRTPELYIVGQNIDKHEKYFAVKSGEMVNLAHGMCVPAGTDVVEVFRVFGFRIAAHKFKFAALTHSCAWTLAPVESETGKKTNGRKNRSLDVFIGGDFQLTTIIGRDLLRASDPLLRIIQSPTNPDYDDPLLYEERTFTDPNGTFEMYTATPELMALQQFESSKFHMGKRVPTADYGKISQMLLKRHDNNAFTVLEAVNEVAQRLPQPTRRPTGYTKKDGKNARQGMFDRFNKTMLPLMLKEVA